MKTRMKIGSLLCAGLLMISAAGCGIGKDSLDVGSYRTSADQFKFSKYPGDTTYNVSPREEEAALLTGYEKVTENRFLTLLVNKETAAVATADKRTGKVWFSNTPAIEDDSEIDEDAKKLFRAQLMVEYLDGQNFKQIDSFSTSVDQKTFTITTNDNKLSVTYRFMDNRTGDDAPKNKELFCITLEYALENESLIASVPMEKVTYPAGMPPLKISVLPHFGGTSSTESGYILVPDGSGALIEFDSGKYSTQNYVGAVYGFDKTLEMDSKPPKLEQVRLPLFGLKDQQNGFLAIIEDGAALASIQANRAGPYSSFNEVSATFATHSYQNVSIGAMESASKLIGIQDIPYKGDLRLRYAFLDQPDANYVGMAGYYREYLIQKDGMTQQKAESVTPFNLELIGTIDKLQSTFGIKYEGMEKLTTTEQAMQILEELRSEDITRINLKYTGWMNGGLRQELADRINIEKAIGGKKGFLSLAEYAKKQNITLLPSVSILTAPVNSKGYNKFRMAAMQIDQKDAKAYWYDYVTQKGEDYNSILSPAILQSLSGSINKAAAKLDLTGLCLEDIGQNVFADYTKGAPIDRETTVNVYRKLLKENFGRYSDLMLTGGFAYAMPYADIVLEAPFTDSGYDMTDRAVPFYQLVYHGFVTYSGQPLNLSYDYETDVLRTIEYGGAPYFQLMASDGSAVKNTDYSNFCSNNYSIWKNRLVKTYQTVNQALSNTQGVMMTNHSKVGENVYKTDYANGCSVFVNYGTSPVTVDGVAIEAKGFATKAP